MRQTRIGIVVVGLVASAAIVALPVSAASSAGADAACVSARVHYERSRTPGMPRTPWVSAGRLSQQITGYLFYYGSELQGTQRMRIYVGGEVPGGSSTKIVWVPRHPGSSLLTIRGQRLDAPGEFRELASAADANGTPVFPSIVNVHAAGCWRLTVSNGRHVSARFAVLALPT